MGGAVVSAVVTTVGAWLGGTTGWAALAKVFFVSFFVNKVASSLARSAADGSSAFEGNNRTQTFRQSASPRYVIYGETRVGGIYTFIEKSDKNRYLHFIVTIAGHRCNSIGPFHFDGKAATDSNGNPVSKYRGERASGTFSAVVNGSGDDYFEASDVTGANSSANVSDFGEPAIIKMSGFSNSANNGLFRVTEVVLDASSPTVVHRLYVEQTLVNEGPKAGVSAWQDYLFTEVRLGDDDQSAMTGLRRLTNKWTSSHRQRGCAHFMLTLRWHQDKFASGVPNTTVFVQGKDDIYDPRDASNKYTNNVALCINDYLVNDRFGLNADYTTEVNEAALIESANNCDELVPLNAGGNEKRYTCNGRISTGASPRENLSVLCSAMAVQAPIYSGGEWLIRAGVYRTPTHTFNEDNLRGQITLATKLPTKQRYNAVKGTYFGPEYNYQEHGFPPVTNATYESQDGERNWHDISLPMTDSPAMAQRIAKIELERIRQEYQVTYPCDLSALKVRAGDVVNVDSERFGWTAKPYEVQEWYFTVDENGTLTSKFDLRETASGVFDWNSGEETTVDLAPNTDLPDPTDLDPVSNLTLKSGTAQLWVAKDGSVRSAILASWDAPGEGFVREFQVQVKRSDEGETEWSDAGGPKGGVNKWRVTEVEDGIEHDVRVRIVSVFLSASDWTTVTNHEVIGKTAVPSDVADFSAQQNRELVTFKWPQIPDNDIGGYEIRYGPQGNFVWEKANIVTSVTKGTLVTNAAVPPGEWTVGIKARDTSKNYSTNATTSDINVINEFNIIDSIQSDPNWLGSTDAGSGDTGVVHHVSGRLVPESQDLAGGNDQDVFDTFVVNPVPELRYTTKEVDIGFDNSVRAWSANAASLGPGEAGEVEVDFYLSYKAAADPSYTTEPWAGGTTKARYFKGQVRIPVTAGSVPYLEELKTTIDTLERTETHSDFAIAAGGVTLNYDAAFHVKPNVEISSGTSGAYPFWSNKTTTSINIELLDSTGTSVGGTVDVKLTGA